MDNKKRVSLFDKRLSQNDAIAFKMSVNKRTIYFYRVLTGVFILMNFCAIPVFSQEASDLYQLHRLFSVDNEMLIEDTLSGIYNIPKRRQLKTDVYAHSNVLNITPNNLQGRNVLIIVNSSIYPNLESHIIHYAEDVHFSYGYGVDVEIVENENYIDVKDLIVSYSSNLTGVVLIGNIDAAYYEIENDYGEDGYRSWPCDLYYMDLDGQWIDSDNNGIYDQHTGNVQPEIFLGRMMADKMGNLIDELTGLKQFLNRDHLFWSARIRPDEYTAMTYINKDWVSYSPMSEHIKCLYGASSTNIITLYNTTNFGKSDYQNQLLGSYDFVQLAAHSSPKNHRFDLMNSIERIYTDEVYSTLNNAIGYNLFCCSACNWMGAGTSGLIGLSYLYNSQRGLFVIGSTKTGSMLGFSSFYQPLSMGDNVGTAFKKWWINYCGASHSSNEISWHYGMTIMGDPFVKLVGFNDACADTLVLQSFADTIHTNLHYQKKKKKIIVSNNYQIPVGTKVIFDAPIVELNPSFICPVGAELEIRQNGCLQ